jgi:hypothetical protein
MESTTKTNTNQRNLELQEAELSLAKGALRPQAWGGVQSGSRGAFGLRPEIPKRDHHDVLAKGAG